MADAQTTAASRDLLRARWGDQRVRSLVAELEQRREQLTDPALRARVAALAEPTRRTDAVDRSDGARPAETELQATAALAAAQAQSDVRQAEARTFIQDHGHQVVGDHAPVTQGQDQRGRQA